MNTMPVRRSVVAQCMRLSALLLSAAAVWLVFQVSEAHAPLLPLTGAIILLAVSGLIFRRGYLLDSSYQEQRRRIREEARLKVDTQVALIDELLARGRQRYLAFQRHDVAEINVLKPGGIKALAGVQRMLDALDERGKLLRNMVTSGREKDLLKAADFSSSPLCFENTSRETITGAEMPELTSDAWEEALEKLFARIEC